MLSKVSKMLKLFDKKAITAQPSQTLIAQLVAGKIMIAK